MGYLIVGLKFTVFALFYSVFEDYFKSTSPGALIFGGAIKRWDFCVMSLEGGAYIWRGLYMEGLFSEFYGSFYLATI